jgi:peptidoglycan/LPS O-acetylase OafA/YrhL
MTTSNTRTTDVAPDSRGTSLARATAQTALVALVVNLAIAAAVVAVLDVDDGYDPLALRAVAITTVLAVAVSGVLLAVLRRFARRPLRAFRVLVVVGALASLGGPLSLLGSDQYPQATGPVVACTAVLHLTTAAAVLLILARRASDHG